MARVQQHSTGQLYVEDGAELYVDTRENAELDFNRSLAMLKDGEDFLYVPGEGRRVIRGGQVRRIPGAWGPGDLLLGGLTDALAAQAVRLALPDPSDPSLSQLRNAAYSALIEAVMEGRINDDTATQEEQDYWSVTNPST